MSDHSESNFEGWAIIEMMGHRKEIGYVTTEHYGAAALFRVDVPGFQERDFELTRPQYVDGVWAPIGSKVRRPSIPTKSVLVGPGSIYALNPCTEELAREAIEEGLLRPLVLCMKANNHRQIPEGTIDDDVLDAEQSEIETVDEL